MLHLIADIVGAVVMYVLGAAHGLSHNATVQKAIGFVEAAEAEAKTVLAEIANHKAS